MSEINIVSISYQGCTYVIKNHIKNEETKCVSGETALKIANGCIDDFYTEWLNGRHGEDKCKN